MKKERFLPRAIVVLTTAILLLAFSTQAQNLFLTAFGEEGIVAEVTTNGVGSTYENLIDTFPQGLAFDSKGDLYVADDPDSDGAGNNNIVEITANGTQKVFSITVKYPHGLAFDSAGDLFEADYSSSNIYEFTNNNGILTSNLNVFASGLNGPAGLAFDNAGDLFEADAGSGNIYEFATNGTKSIFAPGLDEPQGLAFNSAGVLFEADIGSSNIYEFTTNGVKSIFAASVPEPGGLAFNRAGVLFMLGFGFASDLIEILPNNTRISLGSLSYGGGLAFQGVTLPVSAPSVTTVAAQNLFVSSGNNLIEITPGGTQSTFASKIYGLDGGTISPNQLVFDSFGNLYGTSPSDYVFGFPVVGIQGTFASLPPAASGGGAALDSAGILFVAVSSANIILEVTPNGATNVFASGLDDPQGLAFDSAGDLFEADENSGRIYEFTNNAGTVSSNLTVFAIGLKQPINLAFDGSGDLFEADEGSGNIYEFTNNNGTLSSNPTLFASGLSVPWALAFNSAGNLFETDRGSGNIYEFTPNGTRTTFASGLSTLEGLAFEPVPALQASAINGTAQVALTMPSPYYTTILQASPDLVNWTPICTNTPPFTFTNSSPASCYFYRAVLNANFY